MPFKVQVGPPQISIHHGQTVLISDPDGQINWPSERGLYFLDTRVVSSWTVDDEGRSVGASKRWRHCLLRGADFSHQSFHRYRSWDDRAAHAGLHDQPMDLRWHA